MRPLLAATTFLLMLTAPVTAPAAPADDVAAIKEVFAGFARAWEAPGMPGFETLFAEDADFCRRDDAEAHAGDDEERHDQCRRACEEGLCHHPDRLTR